MVKFVLLLGSFDLKTKRLLDAVKLGIAERFSGEGVFAFLLDELEVYMARNYLVLVEKISDKTANLHLFTQAGDLEETYDLALNESTLDEAVTSVLKEEWGVIGVVKLPILEKLSTIVKFASAILLIREKEETRGGEVAELIYCIMANATDRVCLFKKERIALSQMIMEFLDAARIVMRTYRDRDDLHTAVLRYLSYQIGGNNK